MKTLTAWTGTMTLGPFLVLILNSTLRTQVSSRMRIPPLSALRQEEKTETQTARVRRLTLGPFVSLFLHLVEEKATKLRFAEHNHRQPAPYVRVQVG